MIPVPDHAPPSSTKDASEERRVVAAIISGNPTSADVVAFVRDELREALDCSDPPADGRGVDPFHVGCCVLRAYSALTRYENLLIGDARSAKRFPSL